MHNKAYQKSLSRTNEGDGLDFWKTPPQATKALLEKEHFHGNILEPACGTGEMSEELRRKYQHVYSSDIVHRGYEFQSYAFDFFEEVGIFDNVITNPPFNLAEEFVRKALDVASQKVAMLLKLEFLQANSRLDLFTTTPLKTVYIFSYRVPFHQSGYSEPITNQRYAWYVWEHGHLENPQLEWIGKPEGGVDKYWWK